MRQAKHHAGMGRAEFLHLLQQHAAVAADQQGNFSLLLSMAGGQSLYNPIQLSQRQPQGLLQQTAIGIEADPVAAAVKQRAAQLLLQPLNGQGHRRRRDHILIGRFCNTFITGALIKIPQLQQFHFFTSLL